MVIVRERRGRTAACGIQSRREEIEPSLGCQDGVKRGDAMYSSDLRTAICLRHAPALIHLGGI
jgi:hypothetical protein